jgi:hypothetical protein
VARMKTKTGRPIHPKGRRGPRQGGREGIRPRKAKPERVQPGRPSLDKGVSPRISYRVPRSLYTRAKKQADAEGRTVSEVAREALEQHLKAGL